MPTWIPESAIRAIHGELLTEHGGLQGTVNEDLLGATLARPQNSLAYGKAEPSLYDLAATYGFGFAKNHRFTDGNKRIALTAIDIFLQLNGYELTAPEEEAVVIIRLVASGGISEKDLSTWIGVNSAPLTDR